MRHAEYAEAIAEARDLMATRGYELAAFMIVLNREAENDPEQLRRAAAILAGLRNSIGTRSPRKTGR